MKKYTRDTFNLRDRIEGATRNSIILKGDDGEKIYCSLRVFNEIMNDPRIEFIVDVVPEHGRFRESKWVTAYLPTRLGRFGI